MKLQSEDFHVVFAAERDGKREVLCEALERAAKRFDRAYEALAALDRVEAPSKAHVARIARQGNGKVAAPRPYPAQSEAAALKIRQLEQLKRDKAALGGSLTVTPIGGKADTTGFQFIKRGAIDLQADRDAQHKGI